MLLVYWGVYFEEWNKDAERDSAVVFEGSATITLAATSTLAVP